MNRRTLAIILFFVSQILLWIVSQAERIMTVDEVVFTSVFMALLFALLYWKHWTRWVVSVFLGLLALMMGSMALEGFGAGFMLIAFLYVFIIYLVFTAGPLQGQVQEAGAPEQEHDLPPIANGFHVSGKVYHYPALLKRYQSLFIDAMFILTVLVITMVIMGNSEARTPVLLSVAALFLFVYEPLLTAYSATLGQRIMGIRVRNARNPEQQIGLAHAYVRVLVKGLLGWVSFVTINFNPQHRAIHDFASASVMVVRETEDEHTGR